MHSELYPGSIQDFRVTNRYILLLTKNGELFEGKINTQENNESRKTQIRKLKLNDEVAPLKNGSTIKRFTRIEIIAHQKDVVVIFAEAITSNDETVIVSRQA